jgi:hypothetical protein
MSLNIYIFSKHKIHFFIISDRMFLNGNFFNVQSWPGMSSQNGDVIKILTENCNF